MDDIYVPAYLRAGIKRDATGWPTFLREEDREWLTKNCRALLLKWGPLPLWEIQELLHRRPGYPKMGVLWDGIYACIDRALRESADQVWQLDRLGRTMAEQEASDD